MSKNKFIAIAVSFIFIVSLGCNLTAAPAAGNPAAQPPAGQLETQVAQALNSTALAQTALAVILPAAQDVAATATPQFTFTPSLTPTETFTLTPSVPTVTVSVNTNCRSGPTTAYDLLGVMMVGETAEVVGHSSLTDTMIIRLPSKPNITCWLWAQNASVSGDITKLPLIPIPPTPTPKFSPTPQAAFSVAYASTDWCVGLNRIKFKITNTGAVTWESNRVIVTDQNTTITKTVSWDNFPYYTSACGTGVDLNLEAGESGYTTSDGFVIDPSGHSMVATIRMCSKNGLAGTCIEKTINFTP